MKKILFLSISAVAMMLVGCNSSTELTDLTMDAEKAIALGDTVVLSPKFEPADATPDNLEWTSSNTDIAMVDANGAVIAKRVGTANITVKSGKQQAATKVNITYKNDVFDQLSFANFYANYLTIEDLIPNTETTFTINGEDLKCALFKSTIMLPLQITSAGQVVTLMAYDVPVYATTDKTQFIVPFDIQATSDASLMNQQGYIVKGQMDINTAGPVLSQILSNDQSANLNTYLNAFKGARLNLLDPSTQQINPLVTGLITDGTITVNINGSVTYSNLNIDWFNGTGVSFGLYGLEAIWNEDNTFKSFVQPYKYYAVPYVHPGTATAAAHAAVQARKAMPVIQSEFKMKDIQPTDIMQTATFMVK